MLSKYHQCSEYKCFYYIRLSSSCPTCHSHRPLLPPTPQAIEPPMTGTSKGPFPPTVSCVSLGYLLNLSVPQLSHLQNEDNNGIVEYYKDEIS